MKFIEPEKTISVSEDVISYGFQLLDMLSPNLTYHCREHAEKVLGFVKDSISEMPYTHKLSLQIAAVFHDIGFLESYTHNEGIAVAYANYAIDKWSKNRAGKIKSPDINELKLHVSNLIMTTARFQKKKLSNSQIVILDADMVHCGAPIEEFIVWNTRLREELRLRGVSYKDKEWFTEQRDFLQTVRFYTRVAKDKGMVKNLRSNLAYISSKIPN